MKLYRVLVALALLLLTAPIYAATCSAGANCNACSNCKYCGHCKVGGTCSVCRPDLYGSSSGLSGGSSSTRSTRSSRQSTQSAIGLRPASSQEKRAWVEAERRTQRAERDRAQRNARAARISDAMVQQELARRRAAQSALQRSRTSSYRVAQPPSSSVTVSNAFTGKCIGVSDGDTITVLHNNTPVKVRLYGVDAPESKQAFGTRAKQFTAQLAFGKPVTVYGKGTDRYGRVLGWVFVGRTGVNSELVRNGYAWWYRQYSPRETRLQQMEAQAKQARRGLWSDAAAVAPWEFRRRR